jgi:hypothetical protein
LARDKVIKSNSQSEDDQYKKIPHDILPIFQGEEVYGVISGGSIHINPRSSSQQMSI